MARPKSLSIVRNGEETSIVLDFDDDDFVAAGLHHEGWQSIVSTALANASARLRGYVFGVLARVGNQEIPIPICDDTLSLMHLVEIVQKCIPSLRRQLAEAWMTLRRPQRAAWEWTGSRRDAVHAQILALTAPGSPAFCSQVPSWLPTLIETADRAGLQPTDGVQWHYAETPLGRTCMAYSRGEAENPCLVISDCNVSYRLADDPTSALSAIDRLLAYLSEADVSAQMAEIDGSQPTGHEWLERCTVIQEWRDRMSAA